MALLISIANDSELCKDLLENIKANFGDQLLLFNSYNKEQLWKIIKGTREDYIQKINLLAILIIIYKILYCIVINIVK